MNITQIIQMLNNKLVLLANAKIQAFTIGDIDQYNQIENSIIETQNTLKQLTMIDHVTNAAASVGSTPSEVVASGVDAIQNVVQGPSASAVINGYDVSAYATDPLYENKIRSILSQMPVFTLVGDIDTYIKGVAQGSPVTGGMAYLAANQYGIDLSLMLAIMQNDSGFGTLGIGATTFNPGNVGNTGSATRTYSSWQEGVNAVADWLNRHRVVVPTTNNQPVNVVNTTTDNTSSTTENNLLNPVPTNESLPVNATSTAAVPEIVPIVSLIASSTPAVATTTNATFVIPTANATTTPITILNTTSTDAATTTSTTTPTIDIGDTSTATSTSTTTPDLVIPNDGTATTTNTTDSNATTTSQVESDFVMPTEATSTSSVTASSTQARRIVPKGKRRRV